LVADVAMAQRVPLVLMPASASACVFAAQFTDI
jgi:hypothetical protein